MNYDSILNWFTVIILVLSLWQLAWDMWQRTFTWDRLTYALTSFVAAKALFWTWALAVSIWPSSFLDGIWRYGLRFLLIGTGLWVIFEVRHLPRRGKYGEPDRDQT